MKRTLALTILIILLAICSFGQDSNTSKENILVAEFTWRTIDPLEVWGHNKLRITNLNPKDDFLAITFCSTDPLFVAINLTNYDVMRSLEELVPYIIAGYDEKTGQPILRGKTLLFSVPQERILFLRQTTGCEFVKDKFVTLTYWIIHANNELPPFVEVRSAVGIEKYDIVYDSNYFTEIIAWKIPEENGTYQNAVRLTPSVYKTALERTVSFMKENRTAVATIKIPFFGKNSSQIVTNRVWQAQKFLADNGINKSRVYVRKISLDPKSTNTEENNKYPNISVVYEYKQPMVSSAQK